MNTKESMESLLTLPGAKCAAIVDYTSGMILDSAGSGVDLDIAAAGNTEVVRAKMKTMEALNLDDTIEDILITLGKQFHIIRPCLQHKGLFIYYVVDKSGNLAMARRKVQEVEAALKV